MIVAEDIGKNRGEIIAKRLMEINSLVRVQYKETIDLKGENIEEIKKIC